jgi:cytidine deaminase
LAQVPFDLCHRCLAPDLTRGSVAREDMSELVEKAELVAARAYAPYSRYLVGAVVRARDGREFEGVNVENAAYPLGVCAEKNAIAAAVTAGLRPGDLEAIGITASPCGGCRQWLYEFRFDEVAYRGEDGEIRTVRPADLLPDTWILPE